MIQEEKVLSKNQTKCEKEESTLQHFFKHPSLVRILFIIHYYMKEEKFDMPFCIVGGTGTGKSMLGLHIIELWYRVILKQKLSVSHIKHISNTRLDWVKSFQEFKPLDISCNDEATEGLMSKESMTKFGRDIQKLYNVFRKKLFFTILIIPDFFELPLWFRKRVRAVLYIHHRGQFKFYTQHDLRYVNGYNEGKQLKYMERGRHTFFGSFPDYKGILRDPYENMSFTSADQIIKGIVGEEEYRGYSLSSCIETNYDSVVEMLDKNIPRNIIMKELKISPNTITEIRKRRNYNLKTLK